MAYLKNLFLPLFFLSIQVFSCITQATVPANETFRFVNEGNYSVEYMGFYRPLNVFTAPFQLCFYSTGEGYTLALGMGLIHHKDPDFHWVWEANRGNLVGEDAVLTFGRDGNLVLAEADGQIAWQTGTANKGVVGFKLLSNGNMVLHDSNGSFIWQSFDHPTDTLLVGQSLRIGGPTKLVSRAKEDNVDGPCSIVLEPNSFQMYYTSKNFPKPMIYFSFNDFNEIKGKPLESVKFNYVPETIKTVNYLQLKFQMVNHSDSLTLAYPNYNSTLSFLRLGIDGSLKAYTYYDGGVNDVWEETFTLFRRENGEECQLPERCGNFGLCEDSQCVACPLPSGLMGWSEDCQSPKLSSCKDFKYYKVEGVEHFLSEYTKGFAIKEEKCLMKCSSDCECLGYFYHQETSRCWIAYDLKTLTKVESSTHVGYIKAPATYPE